MRLFLMTMGLVLLATGATVAWEGDMEELKTEMQMEVDAIQRCTGVSDAGVKKLEVAATAAINAVKKKHQEEAARTARQPNLRPQMPFEEGLSDEEAEQKSEQLDLPPGGMFQAAAYGVDEVKQEMIWQKTLSNVLNDEQKQAYKMFESNRATRQRARAVQGYVDQLDSRLLFTDHQRETVTKIVDEKIGDSLAQQQVLNRMGAIRGLLMPAGFDGDGDVSLDDLREVLSDLQQAELKRWREQKAGGQMLGFQALQGLMPPKKDGNRNASWYQSSLGFAVDVADGKLIVREVKPDTPAELAGIQVDDVIDSFDQEPIDTLVQLKRAVSRAKKAWSMQVRRGEKLLTVQAP